MHYNYQRPPLCIEPQPDLLHFYCFPACNEKRNGCYSKPRDYTTPTYRFRGKTKRKKPADKRGRGRRGRKRKKERETELATGIWISARLRFELEWKREHNGAERTKGNVGEQRYDGIARRWKETCDKRLRPVKITGFWSSLLPRVLRDTWWK